MSKPNVVFVLGGPGAGKGTQCANIVEVLLVIIFSIFKKAQAHALSYACNVHAKKKVWHDMLSSAY